MKRFVAMTLAVLLVFGLAACGNGDVTPQGSTPGTANTPSTPSTPSTQPTESNNKKDFAAGTVSNNKYVNTYVGISCELDIAWTFMTDEQIRQNNEQAMGAVGEDYAEMLENANYFTDMMATYSNQTDTVSIGIEKMTGTNLLLTEEKYVELSKDSLKGSLESMGMTNVQITTGKETFAGEEHAYIAVSAQYQGIPVYERLAVVRCAMHMAVITTCTWQTDGCKAILDQFKAA